LADRPRVLLIGDSIRLEYQPLVAARLGESVEVSGPPENCGDSANLSRRLGEWADPAATLVVFNAGLHDVRRSDKDGRHQVELDRYEENLAAVVGRLRDRGLAPVFATTTPVDDDRHAASGKPERLDADVRAYNEAARRVMEELDVPVVDLYPLVGRKLLAADGVHLTAEGSAVVAAAVAATITDLL
jgi:lysophospholipase L1-like esterase